MDDAERPGGPERDFTGVAFLPRTIYERELPVLLVTHDHDGSWQFLDGGAFVVEGAVAVHLSHVMERWPELAALLDLPMGWAAERSGPDSPWERPAWPYEAQGHDRAS